MSEKHTPGKWILELEPTGEGWFLRDQAGRLLALVEYDADATLIAAAPALLEACEVLLFSLRFDGSCGAHVWTGEVGEEIITDDPTEILRAAIALATSKETR